MNVEKYYRLQYQYDSFICCVLGAVLQKIQVKITHPEFELFELLNLRWYCLPAISNIGIDIGGTYMIHDNFENPFAVRFH